MSASKLKIWLVSLALCLSACAETGGRDSNQESVTPARNLSEPTLSVALVLLGYTENDAQQASNALKSYQSSYLSTRSIALPPLQESGPASTKTFVINPVVIRSSTQESEAFFAAASDASTDGSLNANAAEQWFLDNTTAVSMTSSNTLVLIQGTPGGHRWRYEYPNGSASDLRAFGSERFLFFDPSTAPPNNDLEAPSEEYASGHPQLGKNIAQLYRDALDYRVTQGAIFEPETNSCHAITLVLAQRVGAVASLATGGNSSDFKADEFQAHFSELTGDEVFLDLKTLLLPVDDPALDALTRTLPHALGTTVTPEVVRLWAQQNFENYHVDHPGCAEYLSFVVYGDVGDHFDYGLAMYAGGEDKRISLGIAGDRCRGLSELGLDPGLPTAVDGCQDRFADSQYDFPRYLALHETGHILGLRHPHDINLGDRSGSDNRFETYQTSMGYRSGEASVGFGAIDRENYQRNQALEALHQVDDRGSANYQAALKAFSQANWKEVVYLLTRSQAR